MSPQLPRLTVHPDSARVDEAMTARASEGSRLVNGLGFLSFSQFVERLEGPAFLDRRPATPLACRIALWAAAKQLPQGPFGSFVQEPAFARAALELIFELKAGAMTPEAFARAAQDVALPRRERALFLARLFESYEAKLSQLKLCDREDLLRGALAALTARGLPGFFGRFSAVAFHDLYDFSPLRVELMLAFARACEGAGIDVAVEFPASGAAAVDAVVDSALFQLERKLTEARRVSLQKTDYVAMERPLAELGRDLFAEAKRPPVSEPPLRVLSVSSARQEARWLARHVAEEVARGTPPERIAVAYRELGEEAEWISEALGEFGIPARLRRGEPLTSTAAGRAALELPLIQDDDFPAEAVAALLESRYLPALSRSCPDSPASLLAAAAVRDDRIGADATRGAYEVRLIALAERLEGQGGFRTAVAARIRHLLDRCRFLFATCRPLTAEGKAGELLQAYWASVQQLGLLDASRQLEQRGQEGTSFGRAVLLALARDQSAIEALQGLVGELDGALRQADMAGEKMTRRVFYRWLKDAAQDVNLQPHGTRGGAVQLLDVRELSGRSFHHVFLGGLTDGRFPGRESPQPLFGEEDRAAVNVHASRQVFRLAAGDLERSVPFRLGVDRLLFFLALAASTRAVTVTFPREASPGRETLPSPFVEELCRVTGVKVEALPAQPLPPLDLVRTEEELRQRVALELYAPAVLRSSLPDAAAPLLRARFSEEEWTGEAQRLSAAEIERVRFFSDETLPVGPHSGAVDEESLLPALKEAFRFGKDRPLSASMLSRFGNCGFQGFLTHALRLEDEDDPGEDLDNRGQGVFWHKVLELLFPRLVEKGLQGKPPDQVPAELIDAAVEEAGKAVEQFNHTGHPALWKLGQDRARAMVRRLLGAENAGLPFAGRVPHRTELAFGGKRADPDYPEVMVPAARPGEEPIWLEGKIDRVDDGPGGLAVVDYKTRRKEPKDAREELLTVEFQLPIYLYALRAAGHSTTDAAWLSLKEGAATVLSELLLKEGLQSVDDLISAEDGVRQRVEELGGKNLANALHELVGALRKGQFAARPRDCKYCGFKSVCRISARRFEEDSP